LKNLTEKHEKNVNILPSIWYQKHLPSTLPSSTSQIPYQRTTLKIVMMLLNRQWTENIFSFLRKKCSES